MTPWYPYRLAQKKFKGRTFFNPEVNKKNGFNKITQSLLNVSYM